MHKPPDLIVVSSSGFDSAGWPLGAQLDLCGAVAEIYKNSPSKKKPLILANGLGIPNRYRINDPVLGVPLIGSKQTELLLTNLGVDPASIVRGQLAVDTIGEGIELLTLLSPRHDNVAWLRDYSGHEPVVWTERAAEFQRSLGVITPHVLFMGPDYQVTRSAVVNMHMLDMLGQPFTTEMIAVSVSAFDRVNDVETAEQMKMHIGTQTGRFQREWQTIREPNEFFDALRINHGLFNQGKLVFHSDGENMNILQHSDRTDHTRLYQVYRSPQGPAAFAPEFQPAFHL